MICFVTEIMGNLQHFYIMVNFENQLQNVIFYSVCLKK